MPPRCKVVQPPLCATTSLFLQGLVLFFLHLICGAAIHPSAAQLLLCVPKLLLIALALLLQHAEIVHPPLLGQLADQMLTEACLQRDGLGQQSGNFVVEQTQLALHPCDPAQGLFFKLLPLLNNTLNKLRTHTHNIVTRRADLSRQREKILCSTAAIDAKKISAETKA